MQKLIHRFIQNESGATAIEYGLIAAIIGVGIISSVAGIRDSLTLKFATIETEVKK